MKNIVIILVALAVLGVLGYLIGGGMAPKQDPAAAAKAEKGPVSTAVAKAKAEGIVAHNAAESSKYGTWGGAVGGAIGILLGLGLVVMLDKKQKAAAGQSGGGTL